jgi:hypothetical protein
MADSKPDRRRWTRDEVLKALALYCVTAFGRFHSRNPDVIDLAREINRTPSSVAMKLSNLASLDPNERVRGIAGLAGASSLDREVWDEFYGRWNLLARQLLKRREPDDEQIWTVPGGPTTSRRSALARRGQTFFRRAVLSAYSDRCCITKIEEPRLLRASHIVRWADSVQHRLNPSNGLCLNVLHDAAYEEGFIALDDNIRLLVSGRLSKAMPKEAFRDCFERYEGREIDPPVRFAPDPDLVRVHRKERFKGR